MRLFSVFSAVLAVLAVWVLVAIFGGYGVLFSAFIALFAAAVEMEKQSK